MTEPTDNAFLGGRLSVLQPRSGYRAGADPVFLAAAVCALPGQSVLELGCGVGTAMLCLATRVEGLALVGVEKQCELAKLAEENFLRNGLKAEIVAADVARLTPGLRQRRFDHVMSNPPFFDRTTGSPSLDVGREIGRGEGLDLASWLDAALKRIVPGGHLTLINRIERLPETMALLAGRAGDIVVLPLVPRQERPAKFFLLQARKGANGPFRLKSPLVLHSGDKHEQDGDSYTPAAQDILRCGCSLSLDD